ncbi:MAG: hypothetical protein GWP06_12635, partial [Actinobacteria bacterium]|nr:hypothetical protein [Actinomycetota bacterium]
KNKNNKASNFNLEIHFNCPQCGTKYKTKKDFIGKNVKCKKCSNIFVVEL